MKASLKILALTMIASASKSESNRCYATQLITRIQRDEDVRVVWSFVDSISNDEPRLHEEIADAISLELESERRKCDEFVNFCSNE